MKRVVLLLVAVCLTAMSFAQDAADKINEANEAMKAKDYAKAFELYESAMGNLGDVQVPDAINYNIGLAAYNSKNYEKAVSYFDKAIAANANAGKSYDYQARSYNKLKQYESAVASYEKAIEADASNTALVYNAGIAAYQGKLNEKAVEYFGKAVEGGYKAAVYKRMKDNDAYKATLVEGVEKFPGDKKMAPALAKIYVAEGNEIYKSGTALLIAANKKVEAGSMTTEDEAYAKEVGKVKAELQKAIEVLEKAKGVDASNKNATALLDACTAQLSALK